MESGKLLKDITNEIRLLRNGVLTDEGIAREVCAVVEKYIIETKSKMNFELNDEEFSAFEKFRIKMNKKYKNEEKAALGGAYSIIFTPTGIGLDIVVRRVTGEELNITDVNSW